MMLWQEETDNQGFVIPDEIVDLSFELSGRSLPVDHAHGLSTALLQVLPWLDDEPRAGIHLIHVAASGNGWFRPEHGEEQCLYLSRRTKLTLRIPKERVDDARALTGTGIDVQGHALLIGKATVKPLSSLGTLLARYCVSDADDDEDRFLQRMVEELAGMGIRVRKALCGKSLVFRMPDGPLHVRSLMLADLSPQEAVQLQQRGLGPGRKIGCGLFIPHKGIDPIKKPEDDASSRRE